MVTGRKFAGSQTGNAWVLMSALLMVCGLLIAWSSGWHFDADVYTGYQGELFVTLNRALNTLPAPVWSNLTLLGDASVLIPLLSPLLLWRPQAWAAVLAAVPVASILSVTVKHLAAVPRPAAVLDHHLFTVIGDTLTARTSFPSGHTLTVFTGTVAVLAVLTPRQFSWRYSALLLGGGLLAVMVGLSRVAVGAHWPLDVLGGALCGLIAGLSGAAVTELYPRWWRLPPGSLGRCLVGVALTAVSLALVKRVWDEPTGAVTLELSDLFCLIATLGLMRTCLSFWHRDQTGAQT